MEGIYQQFYAPIFMLNIVAIINNEAQQSIHEKLANPKHKYKYHCQNVYRHVRDKIRALINNRNVYKILSGLVKKIVQLVVAIVVERTFTKEKKVATNHHF